MKLKMLLIGLAAVALVYSYAHIRDFVTNGCYCHRADGRAYRCDPELHLHDLVLSCWGQVGEAVKQ